MTKGRKPVYSQELVEELRVAYTEHVLARKKEGYQRACRNFVKSLRGAITPRYFTTLMNRKVRYVNTATPDDNLPTGTGSVSELGTRLPKQSVSPDSGV